MQHRGFSLIEVLIVSAVMALFFTGLFQTIQLSLKLIADTRGRLTALTVANDYMEYIRSLSYDAVGTVAGLPSGLLPQTSTTTLNGIQFTRTVLVEYVDDAADGVGAADSNGITTDYKQAKITVAWNQYGEAKELFIVSNVTPRSIETNVGGGTIRVNVFDAEVSPMPGASVRLVNTTGTTSVDVTRTTDATGVALFGGAPAGAGYEIYVSRPGYSSDQTYVATPALPSPTTQPVAVVAADITTMNFFIDELSGVEGRLFASRSYGSSTVAFVDTAEIASTTGATVVGGVLRLAETAGVYETSGVAYLVPLAPSPLAAWVQLRSSTTLPNTTAVRYRFYTGASSTAYTLIPDSELPGNAAGFTDAVVPLTVLDSSLYSEVVIGLTLTTGNTAVSPAVDMLAVDYVTAAVPYDATTVTWRGAKTIGQDGGGAPVYKAEETVTTDSDGAFTLTDIEWDSYSLTSLFGDVAETCGGYPVVAVPGATTTTAITFVTDTAHSLRVAVTAGGVPVVGALVSADAGGAPDEALTTPCGEAFLPGLSEAEYTVTVSAPGYSPVTLTGVMISGDVVRAVAL